MKKIRHQGGYSLVELLVTVAIFALSFVAIAAIFLGFTNAQSRAGVSQRLLNEGNYILETAAREIRMNAIDYDCTAANQMANHDYICLRSVDGRAIQFRFNGTGTTAAFEVCVDDGALPCLTRSPKWKSLVPDFLKVTDVSFQVYPTQNPLDIDTAKDQVYQPMTTILMTVQAGKGKGLQTYYLQTAVSSRVYNF